MGSSDTATTLKAFVDMLLPADEQSASASELGIDAQLLQKMAADKTLKAFWQRGLRWLNKQSGGSFSALAEPDKIELIRWMAEQAKPNLLPGAFFQQIRYEAVTFYYSTEEGWKDSGLQHPPQPIGYPELAKKSLTTTEVLLND